MRITLAIGPTTQVVESHCDTNICCYFFRHVFFHNRTQYLEVYLFLEGTTSVTGFTKNTFTAKSTDNR